MKLPIISEDAGVKIACGRGTGNNFIISDGLTKRALRKGKGNWLMWLIGYIHRLSRSNMSSYSSHLDLPCMCARARIGDDHFQL